MRISPNRICPYPVFSEMTQHYKCNGLSAEIDLEYDSETAYVTVRPSIEDDVLGSMIEDDTCGLYCHIECSSTKYRELFDLVYEKDKEQYRIEIPIHRLNDAIEILCVIVARETIEHFTDENLSPLYDGEDITFPKYAIIGYTSTTEFTITKRIDVNGEVPSIFSFNVTETENCMSYDTSSDQIVIFLPPEQHSLYNDYKGQGVRLKQMMLVLPVLTDLVNDIQKDYDGFENRVWFSVLEDAYKKHGYSGMDDPKFVSGNSVKLAQLVLGDICRDAFAELDEILQDHSN